MKGILINGVLNFLQLFDKSTKRPRLFCLGSIEHNNNVYNLSAYFIDDQGTLYSKNRDTYVTEFGTYYVTLSDGSTNKLGKVVNTMRSEDGRKVTMTRESIMNRKLLGHFQEVK